MGAFPARCRRRRARTRATPAKAFEQAAQALSAIVTHGEVKPQTAVEVQCEAPDIELLFVEWLNAIIYEMAVRKMLFGRFAVQINNGRHDELAAEGILIRSPSMRGVAEQAPGAYKDVSAVVAAAEHAGLARRVARLRPLICIKG